MRYFDECLVVFEQATLKTLGERSKQAQISQNLCTLDTYDFNYYTG